MPDTWNAPTGPPNGVPVHPADAKREIEDALVAARAHDQTLRGRVPVLAAARVEAGARLGAATAEAEDSRALAKRALGGADEAARAGQRADAARLTGAAQVFAMRLRDARAAAADAEARLRSATTHLQQVDEAIRDNVGRLRAVAAARLPALGGRKGARLQVLVDETAAALSAPIGDLVAHGEARARAALAAAHQAEAERAQVVSVDDLEREVDYGGTDQILDELRRELGLPMVDSASEGEDHPGAPAPEGGVDRPLTGADGAAATPPPVPHASGARF